MHRGVGEAEALGAHADLVDRFFAGDIDDALAFARERGGVGYYPLSAIPFVHVDTARVRAWPRLPRQELALLFPSGHTQHMPADGGPLTVEDARTARKSDKLRL